MTEHEYGQWQRKKIIELKAQSKEAREVIEFYGDMVNWHMSGPIENCILDKGIPIRDCFELDDVEDACGGKRARDFIAKVGK